MIPYVAHTAQLLPYTLLVWRSNLNSRHYINNVDRDDMSELKYRWLRMPTDIGSRRMFPCWLMYLSIALDNHTVYDLVGLTNLALNRPAYQTDTYNYKGTYCSPELAVDGIISHEFVVHLCAHTASENAAWEVDLGELCLVESVVIYNRAEDYGCKYNIMQTRSVFISIPGHTLTRIFV